AQVDTIEQRSGQPAAVSLDLVGEAGAFALSVPPETALARIHRSDEYESRRIRRGTAGARDRDRVLLEWLAKRIEDASRELGDLVQEERAAVREAHLAWSWRRPAADEREVRRGVVRGAERTRGEDGMARVRETGHAVDRARRDGLGIVERRKYRLESAREHRLASTGRADEEKVVTARRGDLERALGSFLPRDVREVHRVARRGGAGRRGCRRDARPALEVIHDDTKRCE